MGLVTVTVNSGHRLRPGWVSFTERPLTRRAKTEKQKTVFAPIDDNTHTHTHTRLEVYSHISSSVRLNLSLMHTLVY